MSEIYELFVRAIAARKQIICTYDDCQRALCPHILGHSKGKEVALAYQFGGESKSGLPARGEWRCLLLEKVREASLQDGAWHTGATHSQRQPCVEIVDLDINASSPYQPKRRL